MKKLLYLILLNLCIHNCWSQKLHLKIHTILTNEKKTIDSIGYINTFNDIKSLTNEVENFNTKLTKIGYLNPTIIETKKTNDTLYTSTFALNKKTELITIYIGENFNVLNLDKPSANIKINSVDQFMNSCLLVLEKKGYALAKAKLINFRNQNNTLCADLDLKFEKTRTLDDIIINGYEKFPQSHIVNLKRIYRGKIFNQETLKKINNDINKYRFIKQLKYPEILFTKDSTKVYVYLEKTKPNTFDGFIGFNNTQNKFLLNGYLDLKLNNILNNGEKFNLNWKSDGKNQKTFDASIELPYLFKSPIGIKGQLTIFKQDSIFQNAKTNLDIGYFINYNTKLFIGYQNTESSDIQNSNNSSISDFENTFFTSHLDYSKYDNTNYLFPEKTILFIKFGIGNRISNLTTENQVFSTIHLSHNFYLNKKNLINIRSQNFYLKSDHYIINELFRFGGINSIRGFNENSLQGNFFTSILSEYRYVFNESIYVHSILDYGYFKDNTSNSSNTLTSIGFGFGLLTKNSLFNFVYANGNNKDQTIQLSNSIVQISLKTFF